MKKIGFVDYYISEWHANNYPKWIKELNQKLGTDYEVTFGWAEKDISPIDNITTAQWCEKMGVTKCDSLKELCERSDAVIILAPSNPETHLRLAEQVLPFSKRTYIDKTFAPDLKTAKKIFSLGRKYNTPFFSTSALRYSSELKSLENADNLIITGSGSDFNEYIIHIIEMAVVLLNDPVKGVKVERQGEEQRFCSIITQKGKKATLVFAPGSNFSVLGTLPDGSVVRKNIESDYFKGLIAEILKFFESGELPFDSKQTLEAMTIRDALFCAENKAGSWIEV